MKRFKRFLRIKSWKLFHIPLVYLSFLVHYIQLTELRKRIRRGGRNREFIAIALMRRMGDIVACEPISRYVRQTYPGAFIIWLLEKPYRELAEHNPNVDKTLVVHCLTEYIYLAKSNLFDEVIDLHFEGRRCCSLPLEKAKGDKEINHQNYLQFGSLLSIFCYAAGLPLLLDQPRVYIPSSSLKKIDRLELPENYIVVHCESGSRSKDWGRTKWLQLTRIIAQNLKTPIIEVGNKGVIRDRENDQYINMCNGISILETAEIIRRAKLFVGIDSGPAHLGNAVGTPGVILLGEYAGFKRYLPYTGGYANGENAELIYADGPTVNIRVEEVYQAIVKRILPCS
jgi:ADP-heptose:LPS heptosyltransferase